MKLSLPAEDEECQDVHNLFFGRIGFGGSFSLDDDSEKSQEKKTLLCKFIQSQKESIASSSAEDLQTSRDSSAEAGFFDFGFGVARP